MARDPQNMNSNTFEAHPFITPSSDIMFSTPTDQRPRPVDVSTVHRTSAPPYPRRCRRSLTFNVINENPEWFQRTLTIRSDEVDLTNTADVAHEEEEIEQAALVAIQESGTQSLEEAIIAFRSFRANDENINNLRVLNQYKNMQ